MRDSSKQTPGPEVYFVQKKIPAGGMKRKAENKTLNWEAIREEAKGNSPSGKKSIVQTVSLRFSPAAPNNGGTITLNLQAFENYGAAKLRSAWLEVLAHDTGSPSPNQDQECDGYMFLQASMMTGTIAGSGGGTQAINQQIMVPANQQYVNLADDVYLSVSSGQTQFTVTGQPRIGGFPLAATNSFTFYVVLQIEFSGFL